MMAEPINPTLRGTLWLNEPMARHTSWRVGGPADRCYKPADLDDLAQYLKQLPVEEPVLFVGLGSNLLVRDGGVRGTVILTSGALNQLSREDAGQVRAEAGVACNKVARFCIRAGLVGAEFLAGIPGTMGGALAMNAGAFDGETWNVVDRVETLDRFGTRRVRNKSEFAISYRNVGAPAAEWFVAAYLQLPAGDAVAAETRMKALLAKRNATQPTQTANAGSTFRNPPGDHAARLIESAGLKGFCIGGACVSQKHANFIINTGTAPAPGRSGHPLPGEEGNTPRPASAAEIEALIAHIAQVIQQKFGVELVREVHIAGEALS